MVKIRKLVIPVAGMGTRFLPVTKSVPKEMLPIIDTPTVQLLVDEASQAGIEEILFITSPAKNSVIDHFDKYYELEERLKKANKISDLEKINNLSRNIKISSIRQGEPLGSGHAIMLAKEFVGNEPFAVMYGDDLIKGESALKELVLLYQDKQSNIIGANIVRKEEVSNYGILKTDGTRITALVEKPKVDEAPSNLAGLGRYIFNPTIFDELEKIPLVNGEYRLTDAIENMLEKEEFHVCPFSGTYFDIGSKLGYLKANIAYAMDRDELKEQLTEYLLEILKGE